MEVRSQLICRVVSQLHSPVDIAPVSDLYDCNGRLHVINRIEDAIVSLSHMVFVLSGEFLTTVGSWFFGESSNLGHQPFAVLDLDRLKFFDRRWFDLQLIACHGVSDPSARFRSRGLVL